MKSNTEGWVVIDPNRNHIFNHTFTQFKKVAIHKFVKDSKMTWQQWRRKYKLECVRADRTIKTQE